ncbi:MAG: 16S rRNA (cytosine(967)-C(5))-methyltransferase RsmB [Endomicrobiales bacterium]|nr:16S rRNA (cytosine(967)-C(5))-methyltransferase RsmB [Endomicrobiales bacterium]
MEHRNPRLTALKILSKYSDSRDNLSRITDSFLSREPAPEGGFIRELVRETVRRLNLIDYLIGRFAEGKLEAKVRDILRLGVYQLVFSEKTPEYAAVNETVKLAGEAGRQKAKKLVNAVLRNISRNKRDTLVKELFLRCFHPEWLSKRWLERFGEKEAQKFFVANNSFPRVTARVNTLKITRERLIALFASEGTKAEETRYSPDGIVFESNPELEKLPSFRKGFFVLQDEASQLVSYVLRPKKGASILDVCSGAGIKTSHIAQMTGNTSKIMGVEISEHQVRRAKENFAKLGVLSAETVRADVFTCKTGSFEYTLVDAPCSGLGALRRKPDIKWNRKESDVKERYPEIQSRILAHCSGLVAPGGAMVYATCTTEPEENEDVVEGFLRKNPDFGLGVINLPGEAARLCENNGTVLRTYPHRHGMDAFFAVRLIKKG